MSLAILPVFSVACSTPALGNTNLRQGLPGRRIAGGIRCEHDCIRSEQGPQAVLIPSGNLLLTEQALPTFLFYLPATNSNTVIELLIKDENDQTVYTATALGNETDGIARLDLSTSKAEISLENHRAYQWYVSIVCDEENRTMDLVASGALMGINPAEPNHPEIATASGYGLVSAEQQISTILWLQRLETIDAIRRDDPNRPETEQAWQSLLAEEGLSYIDDAQPIDIIFREEH